MKELNDSEALRDARKKFVSFFMNNWFLWIIYWFFIDLGSCRKGDNEKFRSHSSKAEGIKGLYVSGLFIMLIF